MSVKRTLLYGVFLSLATATAAVPAIHAQGYPPSPPPGGWFGDGTAVIGVIRPSTWFWYLTTPTGGCPKGFLAAPNSDGTPLCYTQFGLAGDVAIPMYAQAPFLAPAIFRPSEGRAYVLAANGNCPAGWSNLGRLATGFVYCSSSTIVRPGMTPFVYGEVQIGAWDPARLTFSVPSLGISCPRGMSYASGVCTLRWGNAGIRPEVLNFDSTRGAVNDDIGFFDAETRAHYFLPSGNVCPRGSFSNGSVNGTVACVMPATPGAPLTPADVDGDGWLDAVGYDVAAHRFSLAPSSQVCPWAWTNGQVDAYQRHTCTLQLGGAGDVAVDGGDFDHDGRVDAVVSNNDTYVWTILPSSMICPVTTTTVNTGGRVTCTRQFGLPLDMRMH